MLPEGCISMCQTVSSQSGVGIAGLGIAGCPLFSVLRNIPKVFGNTPKEGGFIFLLAAAEPVLYLHNVRKMLVLGKWAV